MSYLGTSVLDTLRADPELQAARSRAALCAGAADEAREQRAPDPKLPLRMTVANLEALIEWAFAAQDDSGAGDVWDRRDEALQQTVWRAIGLHNAAEQGCEE